MKNESIINDEIHYRILNEKQKYPDPKKHQVVSFLKSAVRLTGYGALLYSIGLGVFILILSEIIGIVEELV
jgi:hypothetical protein